MKTLTYFEACTGIAGFSVAAHMVNDALGYEAFRAVAFAWACNENVRHEWYTNLMGNNGGYSRSAAKVAASRINAQKARAANLKTPVEVVCPRCHTSIWCRPSTAALRVFCSNQCRYAFKRGSRGAHSGDSPHMVGPNNPNWKGGKSKYSPRHWKTPQVLRWRREVFARDGYTCQRCGSSKGGNLRAHHVAAWAGHPELRFDVTNGVTLCLDCHKWVHSKENADKEFLA